MSRMNLLLRVPLMLAMVVAALGMSTWTRPGASVANAAAYQPVDTESACLNAAEQQMLTLINQYRASKGLPALKVSKALNVASYHHSKDMGTRKYLSHTTKSPLLSGQTGSSPSARMKDAGYGYSTTKAENIAAGYWMAQSAFNGWKNSSFHNANMLNANLKVIGIGYASVPGSPYTHYWTTAFGGVVDAAGC